MLITPSLLPPHHHNSCYYHYLSTPPRRPIYPVFSFSCGGLQLLFTFLFQQVDCYLSLKTKFTPILCNSILLLQPLSKSDKALISVHYHWTLFSLFIIFPTPDFEDLSHFSSDADSFPCNVLVDF